MKINVVCAISLVGLIYGQCCYADSAAVPSYRYYLNSTNYFYKYFDVNADHKADLVISSKPYRGNELIVFLSDRGGYVSKLKTINFSEDGGNIISSINSNKDNQGLVIITDFPSNGFLEKKYNVTFNNDRWLLADITTSFNSDVSQQAFRYSCKVIQHVDISTHFSPIEDIPERPENDSRCIITSVNYVITSKKSFIYSDASPSFKTASYFIKGDKLTAIKQNQDWIQVKYKKGSKLGWINRSDIMME